VAAQLAAPQDVHGCVSKCKYLRDLVLNLINIIIDIYIDSIKLDYVLRKFILFYK
jgi:hypothetical protein